jgi:hypothetical protein
MPKDETPTELHQRVTELEKGHGKITDLKDELRVISMEYADIRYRIEATDLLIDHMIHQLDSESKMRRILLILVLAVLSMSALLLMGISMRF